MLSGPSGPGYLQTHYIDVEVQQMAGIHSPSASESWRTLGGSGSSGRGFGARRVAEAAPALRFLRPD